MVVVALGTLRGDRANAVAPFVQRERMRNSRRFPLVVSYEPEETRDGPSTRGPAHSFTDGTAGQSRREFIRNRRAAATIPPDGRYETHQGLSRGIRKSPVHALREGRPERTSCGQSLAQRIAAAAVRILAHSAVAISPCFHRRGSGDPGPDLFFAKAPRTASGRLRSFAGPQRGSRMGCRGTLLRLGTTTARRWLGFRNGGLPAFAL